MNRKFLAVALLAVTVGLVVVASHFYSKYQRSIEYRYASAMELPTYSPSSASPASLTNNEHSALVSLEEALRQHVLQLSFKPYLDRAPPNVPEVVTSILDKGFSLRNNPAWHPGQPFDWNSDPQNDRNWRFNMNAFDHLEPFIADYSRNKNVESLGVVKEGALDWIQFNLVENGENEFKWYDMGAGIRATHLSYLLYSGMRENLFDTNEMALLLAALDLHVEVLSNPRLLSENNHALFQMLGLAAICKVATILHSCKSAGRYADETFAEVARGQFTSEGMHAEHSSQYHAWGIRVIEEMLATGYFGELDTHFLEVARRNAVNYFYPDGGITLLGDTGAQQACSLRELHPTMEYLCSGGEGGEQPPEGLFAFPESGYAIVQDSWDVRPLDDRSYFLLNAAHHSRAHKQSDDFSFLWYEKGMPILVDSGKHSYDRNKWRDYVVSTRAHNTIEIDGKNYPPQARYAYGSALVKAEAKGDMFMFVTENPRKDFGVEHRRLIVVMPGENLLVMDRMRSDQQHEYRQWFHFNEVIDVFLDSNRLQAHANGADWQLSGIFLVNNGDARQERVKGQEEPRVQGWISRVYRNIVPAVAVSNSVKHDDVILAAIFSFEKENGELTADFVEENVMTVCFDKSIGIQVDIESMAVVEQHCANGAR